MIEYIQARKTQPQDGLYVLVFLFFLLDVFAIYFVTRVDTVSGTFSFDWEKTIVIEKKIEGEWTFIGTTKLQGTYPRKDKVVNRAQELVCPIKEDCRSQLKSQMFIFYLHPDGKEPLPYVCVRANVPRFVNGRFTVKSRLMVPDCNTLVLE